MIKSILTIDCETRLWNKSIDWTDEGIKALCLACVAGSSLDTKAHKTFVFSSHFDANILTENVIDFEEVQDKLDFADLVVTSNGDWFDFLVLEAAGFNCDHAREVSFDILRAFNNAAGHRISLADLAYHLGVPILKSLDGKTAAELWEFAETLDTIYMGDPNGIENALGDFDNRTFVKAAEALYARVMEYCEEEVRITEKIFEILWCQEGRVRYTFKFDHLPHNIQLDMPAGLPHRSELPLPF